MRLRYRYSPDKAIASFISTVLSLLMYLAILWLVLKMFSNAVWLEQFAQHNWLQVLGLCVGIGVAAGIERRKRFV